MKATGIVRRIDDLGRIVIPKEIRKTLRIRETDPLEIFTNGQGEIILKKYSAVNELGEFAKCYADSVATATGQVVCVTDRESVIAVSGGDKKSMFGKNISGQLEEFVEERKTLVATREQKEYVKVTVEGEEDYSAQIISPIICEGDICGSVIMLFKDSKTKPSEDYERMISAGADFIGKQMEL